MGTGVFVRCDGIGRVSILKVESGRENVVCF